MSTVTKNAGDLHRLAQMWTTTESWCKSKCEKQNEQIKCVGKYTEDCCTKGSFYLVLSQFLSMSMFRNQNTTIELNIQYKLWERKMSCTELMEWLGVIVRFNSFAFVRCSKCFSTHHAETEKCNLADSGSTHLLWNTGHDSCFPWSSSLRASFTETSLWVFLPPSGGSENKIIILKSFKTFLVSYILLSSVRQPYISQLTETLHKTFKTHL